MRKIIVTLALGAIAVSGCAAQTASAGLVISGQNKLVFKQYCSSGVVQEKGCGSGNLSRIVNCDASTGTAKCFPVNEKN